MNDVSELTRERANLASASAALVGFEIKIISCVAEHRRLIAGAAAEQAKIDASRARLHEIEFGATGALIPAAQGVTLIDYKPAQVAVDTPHGNGADHIQ